MNRRWLIRILFMLPILLCAATWLWSGTHKGQISYTHGGVGGGFGTSRGVLGMAFGTATRLPDGWDGRAGRHSPKYFPRYEPGSFLGFAAEYDRDSTTFVVYMPCAFPLVVFSGLLFSVWRKTRPKANPNSAFPVVITGPSQTG